MRTTVAISGPMVCTEFVRLIFGSGEARAGDFNTLILLPYLVAGEGLEPPTPGL
jgi:hypothetical protein